MQERHGTQAGDVFVLVLSIIVISVILLFATVI
jgi:hypothetical protein